MDTPPEAAAETTQTAEPSASPSPSLRGTVTIDHDEPDDLSGWVVGRMANRRQEVSLRTSMWKALRLLEDHHGKAVSLETLQAHLKLSSPRAARSTLERLDKKLRDHKIFDVVENVWGRGYRLGTEPYWEAD